MVTVISPLAFPHTPDEREYGAAETVVTVSNNIKITEKTFVIFMTIAPFTISFYIYDNNITKLLKITLQSDYNCVTFYSFYTKALVLLK